MLLKTIVSRNFRNLTDEEWSFHPSVNVFVGENGQGKTNVLEAIHLLATTKSFRTARTASMARVGAPDFYVTGTVATEGVEKRLSIGLSTGEGRRRELLVNGQKANLQHYLQLLNVVAYSSTQLELFRGAPEWRRRFVDRGIASIDPGYLVILHRYGRVVTQRNSVLSMLSERRSRPAELEPWNEELLSLGRLIVESRRAYIEHLQGRFDAIVSTHRYHVTDVLMRYAPAGLSGVDALHDRRVLEQTRTRDIRAGHTTVGPHRDAIEFFRAGVPAADLLSSGEVKMAVLFLTFAVIGIYEERFGRAPLFLLDDLDAELDLGILKRLVAFLLGRMQIFTTSAKQEFLGQLDFGEHRRFEIGGGRAVRITDASSSLG